MPIAVQIIISYTAGFACNCKGFFATVSEANNCEQGEQLTNRNLGAQRARQIPICQTSGSEEPLVLILFQCLVSVFDPADFFE